MKRASSWVAALVAISGYLPISTARAAEDPCAPRITRSNVVACALAASLPLRAERQSSEALEGRRTAASVVLPSNPVLAFSAARRSVAEPAPGATNWYATLSQEIEISGQRAARKRAVESELTAQDRRTLATARDVAASAWLAFFGALAAEEELRLARILEETSGTMARVSRARAQGGVLSTLDADVAEAAALRLTQARLDVERRRSAAQVALAVLLGRDPAAGQVAVEGELAPLPGTDTLARSLAARAPDEQPEVQALRAERQAFEARAEGFRRARIPNITVSAFAQNDGFNERVLGAGLSVPIPLPSPVGRTYAGEIAETEALARRSATQVELLSRTIRLEIATALAAYESRRAQLEAFAPERMTRAQASLVDLAAEIQAGRISVRDAIVSQQMLIDLLRAHVDARRALSAASVDLARASGFPLERGTP